MTDTSSDGPPDAATRAREYLANERTYLAWLRTALAVMALGMAVASFANRNQVISIAAGGVLVVAGVAGVCYGTIRYRKVNRELSRDTFCTGARGQTAIVASSVLVTSVVVALLLLLVG